MLARVPAPAERRLKARKPGFGRLEGSVMGWSRRGAATLLASALTLHAGSLALAQEDAAAQETAPTDAAPSEERQEFERVIDTRAGGNEAAVAAQKRVETLADETDELLSKYRTALKQIDSLDAYNRQMRDLLNAQEAELVSLDDQLERVQSVGRSVTPLMMRMIEALDQFVQLDVPFLPKERAERVGGLRNLMDRADVTTAEKFRQIMEAYQIENEYGRTIEAYRASLELEGRETTVDFLRFGRIALVYQSLDEAQQGVWSQEERAWVPLDSSYRSSIREGLRIARKAAAPDLVRLPLPAPADAREAS
jgi:hypothetical protein